MKKINVTVFFLIVITDILYTQSPGGIQNPYLWKLPISEEYQYEKGNEVFNYNPYKYFSEIGDFFELKVKPLKKVSLFVVFSSNSRSTIGKLSTISEAIKLNDTALISRTAIKYKNTASKPKILSYIEAFPQHRGKKLNDYILSFGNKYFADSIYDGGIAELILFDRLLNPGQRKQIESYLSLKYGIPLPDTTDILSSDGSILWDHVLHDTYVHHLAGIGRDDESGLNQKQSHNIYDDLQLIMAMNKLAPTNEQNSSVLFNHNYLLWSDDNQDIGFFKTNEFGIPIYKMYRTWRIDAIGERIKTESVNVNLNKKDLNIIDPELKIWLLKFNNKKDLDENDNKCYFQMKVDTNGNYFTNVLFDSDNSGFDYFTFVQGPDMLPELKIEDFDCSDYQAFAKIRINSFMDSEIKITIDDKNSLSINPNSGWHDLTLTFGTHNLEFLQTNNITYKYKISIPDIYCGSNNTDLVYSLSPNPISKSKQFYLDATNFDDKILNVEIYNSNGQKIKSTTINVDNELNYQDKIIESGVFFIKVKGEKTNFVIKLIVV